MRFGRPIFSTGQGTYLDYLAIHMVQQHPKSPSTLLDGLRYQQQPQRAWDDLLELSNAIEPRIRELEGSHRSTSRALASL